MDAFDHQQKDLIATGEANFSNKYLLLNIPSVILSMALKSEPHQTLPSILEDQGFPIKNHCFGVLYKAPTLCQLWTEPWRD